MTTLYTGKLFTIKQEEQLDGRVFEYCERPASASTIPITDNKKILVTHQQRPRYPQGIFSLPGGMIGNKENPIQAAQRELAEEAHVRATKLDLFMEDTKSNTFKHDYYIYIGRGLESAFLPGDVDENISIREMPLDELVDIVLRGNFFPDICSLAILKFDFMIKYGKLSL
jgi:ADP-ribose pyrophosphatase